MDYKSYCSMTILMLIMCIVVLIDYNLLWLLLQEKLFQFINFFQTWFSLWILCVPLVNVMMSFKLLNYMKLLNWWNMETLKLVKEKNQMGTLKRVGDTCWCSHLNSLICSLLKLYNATCLVLQKIIVDGLNYSQGRCWCCLQYFVFIWVHIAFKYNERNYGNHLLSLSSIATTISGYTLCYVADPSH